MRAVVSARVIGGNVPKPVASELDCGATTIANLSDAADGTKPLSVKARRSSARAQCTGSSAIRALSSVTSAIEPFVGIALASLAVITEEAAAESLRKVRRLG